MKGFCFDLHPPLTSRTDSSVTCEADVPQRALTRRVVPLEFSKAMKTTTLALLVPVTLAALAGCDRRNETTTTTNDRTTNPTTPSDATGASKDMPAPARTTNTAPDADNTTLNKRDRDGSTALPTDQKENQADVKITAEVRRMITSDDTMSVNARNVKIVTANGMVTLRGPVNSQAEKDAIETKAKGVAGVSSVDNQLEVKSS